MHVKAVETPSGRGGKRHTYYLLVESEREPDGKPRHRVILRIGKLDFSDEERRLLGRCVTAMVKGAKGPFPCESVKVEDKARAIALRVIAKGMRERGQRVSGLRLHCCFRAAL